MSRLRTLLAVMAAVTAGLATIATSPAPGPSARDSLDFEVTLNAVQPMIARRVQVAINPEEAR